MDFNEWSSLSLSSISNFKLLINFKEEILNKIKNLNNLTYDKNNIFLENYIPQLINHLLNSMPKIEEHIKLIDEILKELINLIPKSILFDNIKLFSILIKIILDTDSLFYQITQSNSFSFTTSSKYLNFYKKIFIESLFLKNCLERYQKNNLNFNVEFDYILLTNILKFKKEFNKSILFEFLNNFINYFLIEIKKIDYIILRSLNEKQIMSIFSILLDLIDNSNNLNTIIHNEEFNFCIFMIKSDFLSKHYCGLQILMSRDPLNETEIKLLYNSKIFDHLLLKIHEEIIHALFWLFKKFLIFDLLEEKLILNFWEITFQFNNLFLKEWILIIPNFSKKYINYLLKFILNFKQINNNFLIFLNKINNFFIDDQKFEIFSYLLNNYKNIIINNNEFLKTLYFYIPNNIKLLKKIEEICLINLLTDNSLFLSILIKIINIYSDIDIINNLLNQILFISNQISNQNLIIELFRNSFERYNSLLTLNIFLKLIDLFKLILLKFPNSIKYFFDSPNYLILIQNWICPYLEVFFDFICKNSINNEEIINLIIFLYNFINIDDNNYIGLNSLWTSIKETQSIQLIHFICKIYNNYSIEKFIQYCFENLNELYIYPVLEYFIFMKENLISHEFFQNKTINKWKYSNDYISIKINGIIDGYLNIKKNISFDDLKLKISNILFINQNEFSLKINDNIINNSIIEFKKNKIIKINLLINKKIEFKIPSNYISNEFQNLLYNYLISNQEFFSNYSLKILYYLPDIETEISKFLINLPNWKELFSFENISLLIYRLNIFGKLISQKVLNNYYNCFNLFFTNFFIITKLFKTIPEILFIIKLFLNDNNFLILKKNLLKISKDVIESIITSLNSNFLD